MNIENDLLVGYEPLDPAAFEPYRVEVTQEWETSRGIGFTGDVFLNDTHVFSFENDGNGGCNKYLPVGDSSVLRSFQDIAQSQYDVSDPSDHAVMYIEIRDMA
jgi:hypothetical protein